MLTVPKNEALKRWDTLPDNIRETLVSEHSVEILDRIAKDEHIPEEKIPLISQVAGYVLMGFLHPEEVAAELKERLGVDGRIAESISKSLDSRIFSPLKSQIEKLYAPAFESAKPMPPRPVIIAEDASLAQKKTVAEKPMAPQWKPPVAPQPSPPGGVPKPKMMDEISGRGLGDSGSNRMAVKEMEPPKPVLTFRPSAPSAPARPITSEIRPPVNISKGAGEGPMGIVEEIKKLEHSGAELVDVLKKRDITDTRLKDNRNTIEIQSRNGDNAAGIKKEFQAPKPPIVGVNKEIQSKYSSNTVEVNKEIQTRSVTEKPAGLPSQGFGPVIIHQESDQEPIRPMSSFHLEPPSSQFSSPVSKSENRPAVRVEFGGEKQLPDILAKTDVIKPPRVVHYNTFQTPLENPPGVSTPKTPIFAPPSPVARPGMPTPERIQLPISPTLPQVPPATKSQAPQKILTVNYGFDSTLPTNEPSNLNSMFSKPAEKRSSWLRSIFSKKTEAPVNDTSFTPPTPPLPRPLQPKPPQPTQNPTPQKAFDIKAKEIPVESKKINPPKFFDEKLNRVNLPPSEEMIDLSSLTKITDEKSK